jgi:hypothetical protein
VSCEGLHGKKNVQPIPLSKRTELKQGPFRLMIGCSRSLCAQCHNPKTRDVCVLNSLRHAIQNTRIQYSYLCSCPRQKGANQVVESAILDREKQRLSRTLCLSRPRVHFARLPVAASTSKGGSPCWGCGFLGGVQNRWVLGHRAPRISTRGPRVPWGTKA